MLENLAVKGLLIPTSIASICQKYVLNFSYLIPESLVLPYAKILFLVSLLLGAQSLLIFKFQF